MCVCEEIKSHRKAKMRETLTERNHPAPPGDPTAICCLRVGDTAEEGGRKGEGKVGNGSIHSGDALGSNRQSVFMVTG